jgi:hypothetical protein
VAQIEIIQVVYAETSKEAELKIEKKETPKEYAKRKVQEKWGIAEFSCLDTIVIRESNWNYRAKNPNSSATGIPQALVKLHGLGEEFTEDPYFQVDWMLDYVRNTYGSPCKALAFWDINHWY